MGCLARLWGAVLLTAVATTACPLPRVGDPGSPFFELTVVLEDKTDSDIPLAVWTTPAGPRSVVTEQRQEPDRDVFAVYEGPVDNAFVGGVARLDFLLGDYDDLLAVIDDDDDAARARLAVTRTTLWYSERTWRDVDADAVPFDLAALDDDDVFGEGFIDFSRRPVLFVDSAIASARRCGDDVEAECAVDCDLITGVGDAACCAAAHDALLACDALVVSDEGTARVRRRTP